MQTLTNTQRQILDMIDYYYTLSEVKEEGVLKYRRELCIKRAAKKFYYAAGSLEVYLTTYSAMYEEYKAEKAKK